MFEKISLEVESTVKSELETFYRMSGINFIRFFSNLMVIGVFIQMLFHAAELKN